MNKTHDQLYQWIIESFTQPIYLNQWTIQEKVISEQIHVHNFPKYENKYIYIYIYIYIYTVYTNPIPKKLGHCTNCE